MGAVILWLIAGLVARANAIVPERTPGGAHGAVVILYVVRAVQQRHRA
jgi:uncharacterized membrane protein YeaQ/YmgE (transglycosylase-associated protein family)